MMSQRKIGQPFFILGILVLSLLFISLSVGYANSSFMDVVDVLTGNASDSMVLIISKIRLPRILACVLGGASLALSGLLLQTLTHNPLADSGILGINTGAGFVVALMVGLTDFSNPILVGLAPILAMLGGSITIFLVYLVARKKNMSIHPTRLIITGIGISSMLSGIMVSVMSRIDQFKVQVVVQWLSGSVSGGKWLTLTIFTPIFLIIWLITYSRSRSLNIMNLNEQTAMALGLHLQKERGITLILATALAALSVVLVGNITFVGLVAGHIARKWLGGDHRILIPATMMMGMILLLLADTIGRVLLVGTGIPTGIIVSAIGAPYFLYLMRKV